MLQELDKSNLQELGKNGYEYALRNFKMENIIDKLFNL